MNNSIFKHREQAIAPVSRLSFLIIPIIITILENKRKKSLDGSVVFLYIFSSFVAVLGGILSEWGILVFRVCCVD